MTFAGLAFCQIYGVRTKAQLPWASVVRKFMPLSHGKHPDVGWIGTFPFCSCLPETLHVKLGIALIKGDMYGFLT